MTTRGLLPEQVGHQLLELVDEDLFIDGIAVHGLLGLLDLLLLPDTAFIYPVSTFHDTVHESLGSRRVGHDIHSGQEEIWLYHRHVVLDLYGTNSPGGNSYLDSALYQTLHNITVEGVEDHGPTKEVVALLGQAEDAMRSVFVTDGG